MTGGGTNMAYQGLSQHLDFDAIPDPDERFSLQELIGEGTYGEVYSARDKKSDTLVAVKILENVADNIEEIEEEYLVLRDLSLHPNIPLFYGIFLKKAPAQEEDQLWFVMEVSDRQLLIPNISFLLNYQIIMLRTSRIRDKISSPLSIIISNFFPEFFLFF